MSQGRRDPRVREFVPPTRVVWASNAGVTDPDRLLRDDRSVCILAPATEGEPAGVLLDFGRELN